MSAEAAGPLLILDEVPLRLWLEGCHEEIVRAVARQWLCSISAADSQTGAYRVRLRTEPGLRFSAPSSEGPRRQVRLRARTVGRCTELRMPGARVSFTAGQPVAEVEIHPLVLHDIGLMEMAIGGPLGHALALAGASFLHGAAFVVRDLGILALGGAGAGKSTITAAALAAGGTVVSDDSLVLYSAEPRRRLAVRPLRRDVILREDSLRVLPGSLQKHLRGCGPPPERRWVLDRQDAASVFSPTIEPDVLCIVRQDRRLKSFRLVALDQARALTAVLEAHGGQHLLQPGFDREQRQLLDLWGRLTSSVPAFELRLGPALLDSPRAVIDEVTRCWEEG